MLVAYAVYELSSGHTNRPTDRQTDKQTHATEKIPQSGQYVVGVPEVLLNWIISHYLHRVTGSDASAIFPSGRMPHRCVI